MAAKVISLLVLSFMSTAKSSHVVGTFGGQQIPIDFYFGDKTMTVTSHRPVNAPDTFFSTHLVAVRNSADKECYVQPFNTTLAGMRERVENAIANHGDCGEVKEERIIIDRSQRLPSWSVTLLGPAIANVCSLHDVYLIGDRNSVLLKGNEVYPKIRGRRFAAAPPVFSCYAYGWYFLRWTDTVMMC